MLKWWIYNRHNHHEGINQNFVFTKFQIWTYEYITESNYRTGLLKENLLNKGLRSKYVYFTEHLHLGSLKKLWGNEMLLEDWITLCVCGLFFLHGLKRALHLHTELFVLKHKVKAGASKKGAFKK